MKEEEIRPKKIFDHYLELCKQDVKKFFQESKRKEVNCPSCLKKTETSAWATKETFEYEICNECKTIFVNPRPDLNSFQSFYKDSPSTEYWSSTFYKATENARREKLWKPKAEKVKSIIESLEKNTNEKFNNLIDIGGGYAVFDEELQKIKPLNFTIIEPSIHLSKVAHKKGFKVIEKFMEDILNTDIPIGRSCFVSFELFEHLYNPKEFLETVYKNMRSGDVFIFTTLSGMGIDIQLLGSHSKSLSPPHHLNFFNPKSVEKLLKYVGFQVLNAETPGKLDIDIISKNSDQLCSPFWKNLFEYFQEKEIKKLQAVIQELGISSHMMITCAKK